MIPTPYELDIRYRDPKFKNRVTEITEKILSQINQVNYLICDSLHIKFVDYNPKEYVIYQYVSKLFEDKGWKTFLQVTKTDGVSSLTFSLVCKENSTLLREKYENC